jgi:hypothetical protein
VLVAVELGREGAQRADDEAGGAVRVAAGTAPGDQARPAA